MSDRALRNGVLAHPKSLTLQLAERDEKASKELSSRYDQLNQLFTQLEVQFKLLSPPYPVWIAYDHIDVDRGEKEWDLIGWAKYQGKWRLCHAYDGDANDGPPVDCKPIVECPAIVRVNAAKQISQLHLEIVTAKEKYVPQVDKAIMGLTELLLEM